LGGHGQGRHSAVYSYLTGRYLSHNGHCGEANGEMVLKANAEMVLKANAEMVLKANAEMVPSKC